jgi:hypothetical protein
MNIPQSLKDSLREKLKGLPDLQKYYILVDGVIKEVDYVDYFAWSVNEEDRRIELTNIENDISISTVFDGNFNDEPPTFFETLVLGGEYDGMKFRYETIEEAKREHKKIVNCIKIGKEID